MNGYVTTTIEANGMRMCYNCLDEVKGGTSETLQTH